MINWDVMLMDAGAANALSHFGLAFGAALIVLLFTVPFALRRIKRLQADLDRASAELRETTGFLSRFSNGIWQSDGVDGVMHAAALNVAERVDAESVGIYEMVDGELHGIGVCGPYPLVHGIDKPLLTPYEQLLDAMRRERYEAKSSLFGKLMKDQQRELVPDASVDPRFSEFPSNGAACILSDILETDVPESYFLSIAAMRKISSNSSPDRKDSEFTIQAELPALNVPAPVDGAVKQDCTS